MLKGIDISKWQNNVDYSKLKEQGIEFAIIRCGYGRDSSQKDQLFEKHYKGLKEVGIKVGCYLYSYADKLEDGILEAKNCLEFIKGKSFELPVFYDLEDKVTKVLGRVCITEIALKFCREIEKSGYKAGVYANLDWFKNYIEVNSLINEGYKIWLAQWGVQKPTANFKYNYWQFTNALEVAGLKIDGDYTSEEEISKSGENVENFVENSKSIEELAIEVINGKYGKGQERKDKLGILYNEVQNKVNRILSDKDLDEIAKNVIKGKYGKGQERKNKLGILYNKIQRIVNNWYA